MTQLNPKQVRGLEDALRELEELRERVTKLEEQAKNFVTKDELLHLVKVWAESYQRGLSGAAEASTT